MTKKEENQQSSNISFKLKLIKKQKPFSWGKPDQRVGNLKRGLYEQITTQGNKVAYKSFSKEEISNMILDMYYKRK